MQPGESAGQQAQQRVKRADGLRAQAQALNEQADRLELTAGQWAKGHAGEQTVGAQLEQLRVHGFDVLHDVRWPGRRRANIDHVAVGPPGVLVVDAKNWSGSVTVRDGIVRQNGYQRTREVDGVRQAGRDVAEQLQLPWALHVIPVIALAGSDRAGVEMSQDVTLVGHDELVSWATALPQQLTPGDVLGIAAHLRGALPPASVSPPVRTSRHASPRQPREPSARERKRAAQRQAARRENLLKLIVLAALVFGGPSLFAWWATHGTEVVKAVVPVPTFSPTQSEPRVVATFDTCRALRSAYPHGVRRTTATNIGPRIRGTAAVDTTVYRANVRLDVDGDGIACEVRRKQ